MLLLGCNQHWHFKIYFSRHFHIHIYTCKSIFTKMIYSSTIGLCSPFYHPFFSHLTAYPRYLSLPWNLFQIVIVKDSPESCLDVSWFVQLISYCRAFRLCLCSADWVSKGSSACPGLCTRLKADPPLLNLKWFSQKDQAVDRDRRTVELPVPPQSSLKT